MSFKFTKCETVVHSPRGQCHIAFHVSQPSTHSQTSITILLNYRGIDVVHELLNLIYLCLCSNSFMISLKPWLVYVTYLNKRDPVITIAKSLQHFIYYLNERGPGRNNSQVIKALYLLRMIYMSGYLKEVQETFSYQGALAMRSARRLRDFAGAESLTLTLSFISNGKRRF